MTAKKKPAPAKPAVELPPDVKASDLDWPKAPDFNGPDWAKYREASYGDHGGRLTFYRVAEGRTGTHWVLVTLLIGKATGRRAGKSDRTYAIGLADRKVYRVGYGPHVQAEVTVHLSHLNLDRLQKYVELWKDGMAQAGTIRDRIGTRRAQGQLHRAAGETSWRW